MSSWRDILSDEEIGAIILWFNSLWPDKIFASGLVRNTCS